MSPVLRILVVDDDALVTQTLAGALEDTCQAQVWAAGSGEEGVRLAGLHKPDLILLDLDMPGRDGLDVCRAVREQPDTRETTIWILTGLSPEAERMKTATALADQVLLKPVSLGDLTLAIRATITPKGPWLRWA
jgi:DNA-binding response OmpR family regulator